MSQPDVTDGSRSQPDGKQLRPPNVAECYVCGKRFGSRSLVPHELRCLARWRAANAALPASQRAAAPTKPQPDAEPDAAAGTEATALTSSWPRSNGSIRAALEAQTSPRVSRPRTATLKKPRMLDADMSNELDMSTARCRELMEIVALNKARRAERAASEERAAADHGERPKTIRLSQATKDLNVPNIDYRANAAVLSPDRGRCNKAAKTSLRLPNFTNALEHLLGTPHRSKPPMPRPCQSCGKPENPERFHSHPAEPSPGSSPVKRSKRHAKKRLSTQRPVAMRYRPPPAVAPPPTVDPVAQRKKELEEEQRQKQARLREEYLKKEEKSKKAREEAMRKKLAFSQSKQKPVKEASKLVVCYICGRQFNANSLPIHQPQCLQKWRRDNETLPKEKQRPEPRPPSNLPDNHTVQQYNEEALKEAQVALVPCSICGRTFFPDRVALHERNCRPKDGETAAKEAPAQSQPVVCYICKCRFPPDEISAHEVDCVRQWRVANAVITQQVVLPSLAPAPATVAPADSSGSSTQPHNELGPAERLEGHLDAMIDAAWHSHLSELEACASCGRTFFPDRLKKHQANCTVKAKQK